MQLIQAIMQEGYKKVLDGSFNLQKGSSTMLGTLGGDLVGLSLISLDKLICNTINRYGAIDKEPFRIYLQEQLGPIVYVMSDLGSSFSNILFPTWENAITAHLGYTLPLYLRLKKKEFVQRNLEMLNLVRLYGNAWNSHL